ncbi:MAG: hypothetical protein CMP59_09545 [Flavobacteriales bacterium]|nr:hypothetical protein [Flavobacteriales bacterium]|tara:strand:- start:641 stop:877 length:237 start_codon:yes stop_codon:yes gene_type:complete
MHFVYFLKCSNNKVYTGCTNNLYDRIRRHKEGKIFYTSKHLPVELIGFMAIPDEKKAFRLEKYFKSGSGKAFVNKRIL